MAISHHSHSGEFCSHAKGKLENVVQTAIAQGFTTFGLSEHIPRYRLQDLYPEEEALGVSHLATTFEDYVAEAHRLKVLHEKDLDILVGLETEFIHDEGLEQLQSLLDKHGDRIEYLVGSVHHCTGMPIDYDKGLFDTCLASLPTASTSSLPSSTPSPTTTGSSTSTFTAYQYSQFNALFLSYFDAQYTLLTKLKPEIIGHIDLCRLYYPSINFLDYPEVFEKIKRNVEFVITYGGLFEINAAAFRKGWNSAFPGREVFELIQSLDGHFTLSDDSHGPTFVGLNYSRLYDYLREMKVKELWYLVSTASLKVKGVDISMEWISRGVIKRKIEGTPWQEGGIWEKQLSLSNE